MEQLYYRKPKYCTSISMLANKLINHNNKNEIKYTKTKKSSE